MAAFDAAQLVLATILVNPRRADRECEVKIGMGVADNAVTQSARSHDADAHKPLTVPAAPRPWKNDPRC